MRHPLDLILFTRTQSTSAPSVGYMYIREVGVSPLHPTSSHSSVLPYHPIAFTRSMRWPFLWKIVVTCGGFAGSGSSYLWLWLVVTCGLIRHKAINPPLTIETSGTKLTAPVGHRLVNLGDEMDSLIPDPSVHISPMDYILAVSPRSLWGFDCVIF